MAVNRLKLLVIALGLALAGLPGAATAAIPDPPALGVASDGATADGALATGRGAHQHGERDGHLPATRSNVRLVGKAAVDDRAPGRVGDVEIFGGFAYLAAYAAPDCSRGGVYVFDVRDLSKPRQVGFITTGPASFVGEGMQVLSLKTESFTGDVLLFNNEICGDVTAGTVGGASLIDVTNPRQPKPLALGFGDLAPGPAGGPAHAVHSTFMWVAGDKVYAILVDDDESRDVDVFDITNPHQPAKIAEYDLRARFPRILQTGLDNVFLHDLVVKSIHGRQILLASYWDAGYVMLDVTNPLRPSYVGDTDFRTPDPELLAQTGLVEEPEGNAHEAEFTRDNRFVIAADEDFGPSSLDGRTDDGTTFTASTGSATPAVPVGSTLKGTAVFVGRACPGDPAVPAPPATGGPYIAVAERGVCLFSEKVANVEAVTANGGYRATVIMNREGSDGCTEFGMSVEGRRPAFSVDRRTGFSFFDKEGRFSLAACLAGDGTKLAPIALATVGDLVTFRAFFNGWGYVHLFRNERGKMTELDTFAIPEAMDDRYAARFGALSVHEVATSHRRADLAYLAYYAGGFRVIKIVDGKLREVGRFVDKGGNNFWGVEVFDRGGKEYVAASDRDFGLYIFQYAGPH